MMRNQGFGRVVWAKNQFARRIALAFVCLSNAGRLNMPLENVAGLLAAKGFPKIAEALRAKITPDHMLIGGRQAFNEQGQVSKVPRARVGEAFLMLQRQGVITVRLEALGAELEAINFPGVALAIREQLEVHGNV